jgi:hypothetical protein
MSLGDYGEAYACLTQVVPYFVMDRMTHTSMDNPLEYRLPMALIPLCEYLMSPVEEKKYEAVEGLDSFIDSFTDCADRLSAFLYYYHLKNTFPDAYNIGQVRAGNKTVAGRRKKVRLPPSGRQVRGSVIVFDRDGSGSLEVFGTSNELKEYVEKVAELGDYPTLSRLIDIYALEEQQDPVSLVDEAERLMAAPGVDHYLREKTVHILNVARDARDCGSKVMLYLDMDVPS